MRDSRAGREHVAVQELALEKIPLPVIIIRGEVDTCLVTSLHRCIITLAIGE